ncbi:hypothetical protein SAMN05660350_02964 [Geodermatophilus obscurus]|uniref:Uncharacterized protein n=1 Tax=Geodermatophilus obscurus TaxID=1861 RepID=A0A1M7UC82_9ACTN|nr:hypothetical protein [Geodermatophilus obscurus]SHN80652.1 hypothetical protein SAMN05660350_02964 [Geodermatophilus obscurus]
MDLDEVADELYAVLPDEFVAVRTQRQDDARGAGNRTLAREIGALPKPTAAAWVCNLLVRKQRAEIEGLVELGDLLRQAQEELAGDQLRALDRQRSQLLTALTRRATALAREHGMRVGSTVETQVAETLRAAMADPEAGAGLLSGRLTGAMSYSGLGTTGTRPALRLVSPRPERREAPTTRDGTAAPRRRRAEDARRAAEEARRREEEARRAAEERRRRELEEARRAAQEATALAAEAVAAAEEERHRVDDLDARRADLQARGAELADELSRTEEEAARTAEELERAERHRRTAERHATEAAAARDHALAALRALEEG